MLRGDQTQRVLMTKQPPITAVWLEEWDAKHARRNALGRASAKRTRERKKILGQCARCHHQAMNGDSLCRIHRDNARVRSLVYEFEQRQDVDFLHAKSAHQARQRCKWKSAGLCEGCGLCQPESGVGACRRCKDLHTAAKKRLRKWHKSAGICGGCNQLAVTGRSSCVQHLASNRLRARTSRLLAKERKNASKE